jgi:hypothetical protein
VGGWANGRVISGGFALFPLLRCSNKLLRCGRDILPTVTKFRCLRRGHIWPVWYQGTVPGYNLPSSMHCCALPATPPRHGHQAGHAGYLFQEETAHRQPATDRNTPSTAPGWLVPVGGCLTMHAPCVSTLPVHCCTRPTNPPLHGHRAEYAGYPHRDEAAHFQHAADRNTPSTAPGWPPCRRHVCPHFLRAVMSCLRPHRAMDTGQDIQATRARRRQPTFSQSQATRRLS